MKTESKKVRNERRRWENEVLSKRRFGSRKTEWGEAIKPLYTPDDISDLDYLTEVGFSGEYPYVRGIHPDMYLGRPWTMRQYSGFASAEECNQRYKFLLKTGQTGLSVAFDLPTQIGYNSDHPLSKGEVGKAGVAVDSLKDMETIFEGIPLDKVSTSMTINAPAAILLAMYIVVAEKQGIQSKALRGTTQNDILKEYTVRGTYIFPPKPAVRLIADMFAYGHENVPQWNTISVAGYHMREAGCSAIQEIAFTFANAIAYIEAGLKAGLKIDEFAPRMSFLFDTHNKFFEEVAKYRAARRVWAELIRNRFGAKNPRSTMLRYHTQTAGVSLTAQQPENNIVRVAFQALAAVMGGPQSLAACSFDEALALPTEKAVQLSLRTQQLILEETGVTDTVDPLGGSYYVEYLTKEMYTEIKELISKIDDMGGAIAATESGYIQKEIEESARRFQKEVESGDKVVVGVNKYEIEEDLETDTDIFSFNPEVERVQKAKLSRLMDERDSDAVASTLRAVRDAASGNENLMPRFLDAVKAYATIGEICDVLREVFGEYDQVKTI
jgi:methylmalonyl-CoA mutase N-terminal domain/subunit